MAKIATGDVDESLDIVQDAMLMLVKKYRHKPEDQWKPLFYRIGWRHLRLPLIALANGAIIAAVVLTDYRSARRLPDRQTVADLEILASDEYQKLPEGQQQRQLDL